MKTHIGEYSLEIDQSGAIGTFPTIEKPTNLDDYGLCADSEYHWLIVLSCIALGIIDPYLYKGTTPTGSEFFALQKGMSINLTQTSFAQTIGRRDLGTEVDTHLVIDSPEKKLTGHILKYLPNKTYGRELGNFSTIQRRKKYGFVEFTLIEAGLRASGLQPPQGRYTKNILYSFMEKTSQKLLNTSVSE